MGVADDTLSWKDRCDRYFTSIKKADDRADERSIDEDKDEMTEKSDKLNATRGHEADTWNDLSDIRRRFHGNAFIRYVRKTLSVLDLHGAKFCSKAGNNVELIVWLFIIVIAISGLVTVLYICVSNYKNEDNVKFDVTEITSLPHDYDGPSVLLCNLNLLKKSSVSGSRFHGIIDIDKDVNTANSNPESTLDDSINTNERLVKLIDDSGATRSELIDTLNEDVEVVIVRTAGTSVVKAMAMESPDLLKSYLQPGRDELEWYGHGKDEMVFRCWIGDRKCRDSELTEHLDTQLGNCVKVQVAHSYKQETLRLLLDVETAEYIGSLSPTVGISVSLRHQHAGGDGGLDGVAVPGAKLTIQTQEIRLTERLQDSCKEDGGYSKQGCREECLDAYIRDVCKCSQITGSDVARCDNSVLTQFTCVKSLLHLSRMGYIQCHCPEICRDVEYVTRASTSGLSDQGIEWIRKQMAAKHVDRNVTDIRTNLVEVAVDMKPLKRIVYKESTKRSILSLLADMGGLAALVAGVSLLTVVELIWTAVRAGWDGVVHHRRRSMGVGAVHRLTDSEITSITWAMFRQRRAEEERVKARDDQDRQRKDRRENYIFTGNVQSRLSRRNSYRPPDNDNMYENKNNKYSVDDCGIQEQETRRDKRDTQHDVHNHIFQRAGNQRSRNSDLSGRSYGYREHVYNNTTNMDNGFARASKTGSMERKFSASGVRYVDHNVSMISRNIPQEAQEVGRPPNSMLLVDMVPQYPPAGMYPARGRMGPPADLPHYGESSAQFHPSLISEPMYL